jgi:hypothetical protein
LETAQTWPILSRSPCIHALLPVQLFQWLLPGLPLTIASRGLLHLLHSPHPNPLGASFSALLSSLPFAALPMNPTLRKHLWLQPCRV